MKKNVLTRSLALSGTALVWLPILASVLLSVVTAVADRAFRFDYLIPAELFPLALAGGGLLIWAALRAHSRQRLIGWGLGIAAGLLVGGMVLASVTGLASGETEPTGWQWMLVVVSLAIYSLALVAIGTGGVLLVRDLFETPRSPTESH
jgi:peptidoglycan/LPS O-acetylase OafA/YrhL